MKKETELVKEQHAEKIKKIKKASNETLKEKKVIDQRLMDL
jgi:hypothetical protein